jgi:hypothetical protein
MPRKRYKELTPVQLELVRLSNNTARTKRLQALHHSIRLAAEQSNQERRRRKAFAKARSVAPAQNTGKIGEVPGNQSVAGLPTQRERKEASPKVFRYGELIIGLLFGFLIGIQVGLELGLRRN